MGRGATRCVPINVGLDFTAIGVRLVDITEQLVEFEDVYIYARRRSSTVTGSC